MAPVAQAVSIVPSRISRPCPKDGWCFVRTAWSRVAQEEFGLRVALSVSIRGKSLLVLLSGLQLSGSFEEANKLTISIIKSTIIKSTITHLTFITNQDFIQALLLVGIPVLGASLILQTYAYQL